MAYNIANPAAGNIYFDNAGSAASITTDGVGSGVAVGLGSDRSSSSIGNKRHGVDVVDEIGSLVPSGMSGTAPVTTAGVFGQQTDGSYIVRRVTDSVAGGVANTSLRSGGSQYGFERHNVHKVETAFRHTATATAVRDGNWNVFSGVYDPEPGTSNDSIGNVAGSTVSDGSADHEANVTRADQGSFTFKSHALNPATGDYSPKLT